MKTRTAVTIALSALMLSSVNLFANDDEGRPERPPRNGDHRERMEKLDTNQDGKISSEEFPGADERFNKMDADGYLTREDRKGRGRGKGNRGEGRRQKNA